MNYQLLIRTLIDAIKAVEALMPASPGKDKFDIAIGIVEGIVGDVGGMLPALLGIATTVVNGLHASGAFTKKA